MPKLSFIWTKIGGIEKVTCDFSRNFQTMCTLIYYFFQEKGSLSLDLQVDEKWKNPGLDELSPIEEFT